MESVYAIIKYLHIAIGALALIGFWTAGLARKGSQLHRRAGQLFLLAMSGIVVTAVPMTVYAACNDKPNTAAFLAYLIVITATGTWASWRAIRDKRDVYRYTGPVYTALATASAMSGAAMLVLGFKIGAPLFIGFSSVGLYVGIDMLRKRRGRDRLAAQPRWWLVEHYTAMIGNGIAVHIAFLGIGLPRLLPMADGVALHYAAWFGPLLTAIVAKLWADRKWGPRGARKPAPLAQAQHIGG
ncbi:MULTISPECIES: hypothetical protein [unclassified Lysobacter]|uniref:hypothetical protein n=1 Tax=unclassified Lysobacter TaxID=2635362 RepID=UPI001BEC103D|nr:MULTISPECIES: hypothetical protein [unclassified Lysobacter]MBT2750211.1 hypothetical protein [Lysobacter sp. ISL-50]MBT2775218.1 hypothetical protein [Lysobacter sp. ISL-54]MBT2782591.1 hypothetical protein [Lysobacter sp. ISL-52]